MKKEVQAFLVILVLVLIVGLGIFFVLRLVGAEVDLSQEFESNAFSVRYPDGWTYQIPQPNIMFLASPEVTQMQAGATMSIQRSLRLSAEADSIASALNIYLERGPLRQDRAWTIVEEVRGTRFDGRDALFVAVEGSEDAGTLLMRSEITVTASTNGNFYIFTANAPVEQWEAVAPSFEAILESVKILE
jgi:hypothetical protein